MNKTVSALVPVTQVAALSPLTMRHMLLDCRRLQRWWQAVIGVLTPADRARRVSSQLHGFHGTCLQTSRNSLIHMIGNQLKCLGLPARHGRQTALQQHIRNVLFLGRIETQGKLPAARS